MSDVKAAGKILAELNRRREENTLSYFKPYPWQKDFLHARDSFGELASQILLRCANQVGKEVRITEPVLTPDGWVGIGDLSVGDAVCDPSGGIGHVRGYYPQGKKEMYRIHFDDGTFVDCGLEHQWRCKGPEERFRKTSSRYGEWKVETLANIMEHVGSEPKATKRYSIPITEPVSFNEQKLPLDAYTLGLLLGDGGLTQGVGFTNGDGLENSLVLPDTVSVKSKGIQHFIVRNGSTNDVTNILRRLGLYGKKSIHKFVPDLYKYSPERLEVLRGLMDTDGHAAGSNCEFTSCSEQLANDVVEICNSLGIRCSIKYKKATWVYKGSRKYTDAWKVSIWTTDVRLFNLERKAVKQVYSPRNKRERVIRRIEQVGFDEAVCISVDTKDSTYLISNCTVTHNTYVGAKAVAYHATGLYPDDWEGKRIDHAPIIWVGGNTIPNTRDLCQSELLGEAGDQDDFGHGAIPKHLIGRQTKYHGIPDALQSVLVKHTSGKWAKIVFKAYEQGKDAWMGKGVDYVWGDEEMPYDIYSQCLRATLRKKGITTMTATPENGMTQIMRMFEKNEIGAGQAMITATWDDAPHLDEETKQQTLNGLLPYEREMRSKGIPVMGSGLVWPIGESKIMCDPFKIPDTWERIAGIDFAGSGSEGHPTALVSIAIDPSTEVAYVYDTYRESGRPIPEHWLYMQRIGNVPIAWPHDGLVSDRGSGVSYKQQYADVGANMLPLKFSNPPAPGAKEGSGGNGVKAGLTAIFTAMVAGKFKVFSNQTEWFEEFRQYYQKDGDIVKEGDDLMAATRYAYCSKRFAEPTFLEDDDDEDYYEHEYKRNATTGY